MIDISFKLLAIQILTFGAALFVMWKLFWGPLMNFMKNRSRSIENDITAAKKGREDSETLEKEYRAKLSGLGDEARKLTEKAVEEGEKSKETIVNGAREDAKRMISAVQNEISGEKRAAMESLKEDIVSLSITAAEKIIEESISRKAKDKYIDEFLEGLK
jgi:F-type H+-transporting ATPase subunit b